MPEPSRGFPRNARLLKAADFQRVLQARERSIDGCFVVFAHDNAGRPARLGLAIARKHARRAVDRNRIKRIVRERFRQLRTDLAGKDFVVFARSGTAARSSQDLHQSLIQHWRRFRSAG